MLFDLPDVSFEKIKTPEGFESAYELRIKQAIDHNNPDMGHFYHRVFLSHKGFDHSTTIITNGYSRPSNNITEVARFLDANQLNVEHRYFGESNPDSLDYSYLNFEQITADLHKIKHLFRNLYKEKWVSTGISKGETTTIFYRYFYPEDVDVSIPYVAPINYSDEDERIYDFLNSVGSDECRKNIYDYQVRLLRGSETIKPFLKWYAQGKELEFNYLNFDEAYELAVLEYPFAFWQYGKDCHSIPSSKDNTETHIQHFLDVSGLDLFADSSMKAYGSHYYQSATEMGYYGYETEPFKDLLKHIPLDPHPSAAFVPDKMDVKFNGDLTNKVAEWTVEEADNMIYINGALDTWSATAVQPSDKTNSLFYFLEGKHHSSARIKNMTSAEQNQMCSSLSDWLEQPITIKDKKSDIELLIDMMTGSFSSADQAEKDSSYYDISLHMYPIWKDKKGHWIYVEQAASSFQEKPYRQRIYRVDQNEHDSFESIVYAIKGQEDFVGKWKTPEYFDQFDTSILKERIGCTVYLKKDGYAYHGSTNEKSCRSSLSGASFATSKVTIEEREIKSWDQGFDKHGTQVWGAQKGAYIFKRR